MPKFILILVLIIGVFILMAAGNSFLSNEKTEPTKPAPAKTRGPRILAIDVNTAQDNDFDRAFNAARKASMNQIGLFLNWDMIETRPEKYDATWLDIASAYYPSAGIKVDLSIVPINTNQKAFPSDLSDKPVNDPGVIARFKKLLDFVFVHTEKLELDTLNIGSEFDIPRQARDEAEW